MSKQRQVVYTAVTNSCDHPTAETVLARCKEIMPSINIATVYRNLNALCKEGLVKRVAADGGDRFDKTLTAHAHFQCRVCNCVTDIEGVDLSGLCDKGFESGDIIEELSVTAKGVCRNCIQVN